MKKTLLLHIIWMPILVLAQGSRGSQATVYLDKDLRGTTRKHALFTGMMEPVANGYQVQILNEHGKPMYAGTYADKKLLVKEGLTRYYHTDGSVEAEGMMKANQKTGIWLYWHTNRQLKDSGSYEAGHFMGQWKSWHPNGQLQSQVQFRSILITSVDAVAGTSKKIAGSNLDGPYQLYFDNGNIEALGQYSNGNAVGKWQWWRKNGQRSITEYYNNSGKVDSMQCYDSTGRYEGELCSISKPAVLQGLGDFRAYMAEKFFWPETTISLTRPAMVKVSFTVNMMGKMEQLRVESTERLLAEIVHRFIKQLPDWYPAVSHNRTVTFKEVLEIPYVPRQDKVTFYSMPMEWD